MSYEAKDNTGTIFKNDKKEKDTHPDRQGSCVIDGKEYWISGWMKKTSKGDPFMSLSFKPKEARSQQPSRRPAPRQEDDESSVPF